jgi:hypothetical protein
MQPTTKTPTSSLSGSRTYSSSLLRLTMITMVAIELLAKRVWYRTYARIGRMCYESAPPEASAARSSPASRIPQEIIENILAYLIYDNRTLRACTMTCYSWYIAAAPHLHHTLVIQNIHQLYLSSKFAWPNLLRYRHTLGLLPLVKKLWIHQFQFSPRVFNRSTLRQFSALTNVCELDIEFLNIPSFMPRIRRHFQHFLPTVRSLALKSPKGSCRQVIYFIGLFEHLQDLKLLYDKTEALEEPVDDLTLVPPFTPPLRGWLTMVCCTRVGLLKDMIDLFGGIRFR